MTAMAVVLAACMPATRPAPTVVVRGPTDTGRAATTLPPAPRDPLQDEILADGVVTPAEMERALLAVVECVRDAGFSAELIEFDPAGSWGLEVSGGTEAGTDQAEARWQYCSVSLTSEVETVFMRDHVPSEADRAQQEAAVVACVRALGYEVDDLGSIGRLHAALLDEGNTGAADAIVDCTVDP